MGLFDKMKEPVFLKESSDAYRQLEVLKNLESSLTEEGKVKIRQDIKFLEYGIVGENNIAFELKNCHMPIYILHDIYLEDKDLSAQIDYLVVTKKMCFVIECKNLFGDIEINNAGDFIRIMDYGGKKKKEGLYSPITQNQRHLELIKKIKIDQNSNFIIKNMMDKSFGNYYKSIVVLANPKTVLNAKYAKKEVKDKVIRGDQLVAFIKDAYKQSNEAESSEEKTLEWAKSFLRLHKEIEKNYTEKYQQYKTYENEIKGANTEIELETVKSEFVIDILEAKELTSNEKNKELNIEDSNLYNELKAYRLAKSREEKIKPYFLYNDNQLKDLISKMPKTPNELLNVEGFGQVKVNKYGEDILNLLKLN